LVGKHEKKISDGEEEAMKNTLAELDKLRQFVPALHEKLKDSKTGNARLEKCNATLESNLEMLKEKNRTLEKEIDRLNALAQNDTENEEKIKRLNQESKIQADDIASLKRQVELKQEEIEKIRKLMGQDDRADGEQILQLTQEISEWKDLVRKLEEDLAAANAENARLQKQHDDDVEKLKTAHANEIDGKEVEIDSHKSLHTTEQDEHKKTKDAHAETKQAHEETKQAYEEQIGATKKGHEEVLSNKEQTYAEELAALKAAHEATVEELKAAHVETTSQTEHAHGKEIEQLSRYQNAILAKNEERKGVLLEGLRLQRVAVDARTDAHDDEAESKAALQAKEFATLEAVSARKDAEFAAEKAKERLQVAIELAEKAERKSQCKRKMLTVTVDSAKDLVEKDTGIFGDHSDPYVAVVIKKKWEEAPAVTYKDHVLDPGEDEYCNDAYAFKTKVIDNNLNPVWREDFNFERESPEDDILYFMLWDFDEGEKDNSLGYVAVSVKDVMKSKNGLLEKSFGVNKKSGILKLRIQYYEDSTIAALTADAAERNKKIADEWLVNRVNTHAAMICDAEEQTACTEVAVLMEERAKKSHDEAELKMQAWMEHRHACEKWGFEPIDPGEYDKKYAKKQKALADLKKVSTTRKANRKAREEKERAQAKETFDKEYAKNATARKAEQDRKEAWQSTFKMWKCGKHMVGKQLKGSGEEMWRGILDAQEKAQKHGHVLGKNVRYIQCSGGKVLFYAYGTENNESSTETWRFDPAKK